MAGVAEPASGSILTFEPEGHVYRVDGARVPSVTELLEAAGVSPDYRKVHPAVLRHARLRGIHVDKCCDLDDADDLDWSSVDPEAVGYVQAWQAFKADYGYEPVISKPLIYHPTYRYAGEPDSIGMLDDYVAVAERKATAKMAATYALQTAGYACNGLYMAPRGGGLLEPVPWGGPVMRLGVHLMPGGRYELVPYEDPDDEAAWLGVIALARWRKLRG
jgi:hypothetical protein